MAAIGRRGGEARGANRAARMQQNNEPGQNATAGNGPAGSQRFQGDREVGLSSATNGAPSPTSTSGQGTSRQSGNSLGGERNTGTANAERNVERP
jgi:hypothetical protein